MLSSAPCDRSATGDAASAGRCESLPEVASAFVSVTAGDPAPLGGTTAAGAGAAATEEAGAKYSDAWRLLSASRGSTDESAEPPCGEDSRVPLAPSAALSIELATAGAKAVRTSVAPAGAALGDSSPPERAPLSPAGAGAAGSLGRSLPWCASLLSSTESTAGGAAGPCPRGVLGAAASCACASGCDAGASFGARRLEPPPRCAPL
mmetsp:Transcript_14217/g.36809  ORF Transcript_14217/g.36809 Transcript_14217/m.36809 type:complete len:206 (+) Transcript_14217:111-728(+)